MTQTGFDPESPENKFARKTRELVESHVQRERIKIPSFDEATVSRYIAYLAQEVVKPPTERTVDDLPESKRFPLGEELHSIINCYFMQVVADEPTYENRRGTN